MPKTILPVVLSGGLAVPCNPKSAYAGLKGIMSSVRRESSLKCALAMKVGSGNDDRREPRQDRKVATVSGVVISYRGAWLESVPFRPSRQPREYPRTTGL